MKPRRSFLLVMVLVLALWPAAAPAAISLVTAVSTNVTTASTNYGPVYSTSESSRFNPQTFNITHTNLLTPTNLTLIYRVTYDGGVTWANVTSTNALFNSAGGTNWQTAGTNTSPETWLPFGNTGANVTRSNQVVAVTQTNASFTVIAGWQ